MELVTEPDITSAKEAREFAQEIHSIMQYLDVSDADMEKGQMRVEVNISLSKKEGELGTKVEIKNLNSFRAVERGIEYEIQRQAGLLEKGEKIIQETRGWDDEKEITVSQREKEEAHDYRYFPEPDLPPLHHSKEFIDAIRAEIPELPQQKRERFFKEYQLDEKSIEIFVYNKGLGEIFEATIKEESSPESIKLTANSLINDIEKIYRPLVNGLDPKQRTFFIENFRKFIIYREKENIGSTERKNILKEMILDDSKPFEDYVDVNKGGAVAVKDSQVLQNIIDDVIKNNPQAVEDYKKGKENALQFLIGEVMKIITKNQGRANPQAINKLLQKFLQ